MHSSDYQLRALLDSDCDTTIDLAVNNHVEQCAHCQTRLANLSGAGNWTNELVGHLRSLEGGEFALSNQPTRTTVELQSSASESDQIELEQVSLDFLEPAVHPELLGRLGRYDIERVVGSGGMGVVFKAHDGELHRAVAIKVLAPHLAHSVAARKRFAREAQAAAAVLHPNVIPIYDVESEGKLPYLVMQYVAGESLQKRVNTQGPLPVIDTLRIAQQTVAGLSAAHAQGLIHRDVKPANILLEESVDRVVLSDFGLARTVDDASLTRTGIVAGTPHYMSPEQANGDAIDCRSDLFSLGCVIYFMLTGRPPFRAPSAMGVLNRICHHTHRPVREVNSAVPRELSRLVDRLLAKAAAARYESAAACEAELSQLLVAAQSGRLQLVENNEAFWLSVRRLSIAAAVLFGVAIAFASWRGWERKTEQESAVPQLERTQNDTELGVSSDSPVTVERVPVQERAAEDAAVLLMQSYKLQSYEDAWKQSARSLSERLLEYERRDTSPARMEQQFRFLEQQEQQSSESLQTLEEQLRDVEESLNRLRIGPR